jgi:hypothetical protein
VTDLHVVPDNIVDMDEYRARRIKEGTWPPDDSTVREYWLSRKGMGMQQKPAPQPPPVIPPRHKNDPPNGAA